MEGENKLSDIKGIEIELLNGQKALIYPKYAEKQILTAEQIKKWVVSDETEIEALKVTDTVFATKCLHYIDSPAAEWVSQFKYTKYSNFALPSLLAAMEIQYQKKEIDALVETIEGADLLRDFIPVVWSCSRYYLGSCWCVYGKDGHAYHNYTDNAYLVVPTILYQS